LDNMKWLKEIGCPWDNKTFTAATIYGNLNNMKWLKENGCPWDIYTFYVASRYGNLDNIKWLRENGCSSSEDSLTQAYSSSEDSLTQTYSSQVCSWNERIFEIASENNNLDILKFLNLSLDKFF